MATDKPTPSPRRQIRLGSDWLMVAVGILALAGSLFLFIESDAPRLSQVEPVAASTF